MALWRWGIIAALGTYVTFVALRAVNESWNNDAFPEALAIKLENLPLIFPLHMVTGGLALLLVLLTLSLRGTRWHKLAGRITAADVVVAGLTAIPVALDMPVTKISAAGFATQGMVWMALLGAGLWHIRHGNLAKHQTCMLLMAAVTSGALFFRLYLGLWKLFGVPGWFYTFYAVDAWMAWALPLAGMAVWMVCTTPTRRPHLLPASSAKHIQHHSLPREARGGAGVVVVQQDTAPPVLQRRERDRENNP